MAGWKGRLWRCRSDVCIVRREECESQVLGGSGLRVRVERGISGASNALTLPAHRVSLAPKDGAGDGGYGRNQ